MSTAFRFRSPTAARERVGHSAARAGAALATCGAIAQPPHRLAETGHDASRARQATGGPVPTARPRAAQALVATAAEPAV